VEEPAQAVVAERSLKEDQMPKSSIVETAPVYCHAPVNYVARSGDGDT